MRTLAYTTAFAVAMIAVPARAEDPPPGLMKEETATTGKEDVATPGFAAPAAKPDEATAKDATELKLSAGGLLAGGNADSLAVTSAGKFRMRRSANQLEAALVGNYGRAAPEGSDTMETTVENFQGKVRYDRFITERVALFLSVSALHDRFQGLDARLNIDPGVAYYFIDEQKHRFWTELGYDYQYEFRNQDAVDEAAAAGTPVEQQEDQHAARLFAGYENNLTEVLAFDTGLEYLQPFSETQGWRLNWNAGLSSAIGGNFSLAATFNLRYDNEPLPEIEKTDYISALSLVYQLL